MPRAIAPLALLLALLVVSPARAGDAIMPLSDLKRGMHCTGLTVVQGTDISSFDVEILDVVVSGAGAEGPMILVRVSGPAVDSTGVARGFSGSPVYCTDGQGVVRNAGAISLGVGSTATRPCWPRRSRRSSASPRIRRPAPAPRRPSSAPRGRWPPRSP